MGEPAAMRINGAAETRVSALDRGLQYGDGLFETIACRGGRPRFLDLHRERLMLGCERLKIAFKDWPALEQDILQLASGADTSIVKVIVTRGEATARGYAPSGDEHPTRIVARYEWPVENPAHAREGVPVRVASLRLGENPALAGLKHLNRLELVLARAEQGARTPESLLFSSSGLLVCGTMSNVFLVQSGRIVTPRLDRCGVEGIMRRVVMRECSREGLPVSEKELTAADLDRADEVFLTNARIGIWPVRAIDERTLVPGPVTRHLQEKLGPLLEA